MRFQQDVQKESESGSIWKVANRIKGSLINNSSPIQGSDGVIFDARGKVTAVADCLKTSLVQMRPMMHSSLIHYQRVRRRMQLFRNTRFDTSIQPVSGNEVKTIVKHLKLNKAAGFDMVTNYTLGQR